MARKDYERIAELLRQRMQNCRNCGNSAGLEELREVIEGLCAIMRENNPRFDCEQFRSRCGLMDRRPEFSTH